MRTLSLRERMSLEISIVVLLTGLGLAGVMLWFQFRTLQSDMQESTARLARVLAHATSPLLALHDRWQIYQTIKVVYTEQGSGWLTPAFVLVMDTTGHVVAATDPDRFPTAGNADALGDDLNLIRQAGGSGGFSSEEPIAGRQGLYWRRTLRNGDTEVGILVLGFSRDAIWPQFGRVARQLLSTIAVATFALLPFGWWLGRRMAQPLEVLDECVAKLSGDPELPLSCPTTAPYRELSRLRDRVERVAIELQDRKRLEQQMARAQKQAVLGRLAAGVAHEINNPLGGMQAAIGMHKRHGSDPEVTRQTLSLLERGLEQIRHVVAALLIEAKPDQRKLMPRDVDDIAELVAPILRERDLRLAMDNRLAKSVSAPAAPVRQVLLNLVLNAVQAAPVGGEVHFCVESVDEFLRIEVDNAGAAISRERLRDLFEPVDARHSDEASLGLWLTKLTVDQLGGDIDALSRNGRTTFIVKIPLGVAA